MKKSEAFSRVLIDRALEASGWDLLDPHQVHFEQKTPDGRADYLLKDTMGRTLCVLEAKREDLDPYDAKEQARGYAENLRAPFVIVSNGREHWIWNYERADQRDAYRIERLPSRDNLERVRLKNLKPPRPLQTEVIRPNYLIGLRADLKLRGYQIRAMDTIAKGYDHSGRRKFLLEMATGTGKTLLCAAMIRRFLTTRNAERVLFIVDRIELAKQTMEDFNVVLGEYKPVIFKTARRTGELLGSSVVVATIQSLMADRRYREDRCGERRGDGEHFQRPARSSPISGLVCAGHHRGRWHNRSGHTLLGLVHRTGNRCERSGCEHHLDQPMCSQLGLLRSR